jgi:hypothetical protein
MTRTSRSEVADSEVEGTPDSRTDSTPPIEDDGEYTPRTPLGRELVEIRKRIVASGQPLLDWDDLEREVAERRGGVRYDE